MVKDSNPNMDVSEDQDQPRERSGPKSVQIDEMWVRLTLSVFGICVLGLSAWLTWSTTSQYAQKEQLAVLSFRVNKLIEDKDEDDKRVEKQLESLQSDMKSVIAGQTRLEIKVDRVLGMTAVAHSLSQGLGLQVMTYGFYVHQALSQNVYVIEDRIERLRLIRNEFNAKTMQRN